MKLARLKPSRRGQAGLSLALCREHPEATPAGRPCRPQLHVHRERTGRRPAAACLLARGLPGAERCRVGHEVLRLGTAGQLHPAEGPGRWGDAWTGTSPMCWTRWPAAVPVCLPGSLPVPHGRRRCALQLRSGRHPDHLRSTCRGHRCPLTFRSVVHRDFGGAAGQVEVKCRRIAAASSRSM